MMLAFVLVGAIALDIVMHSILSRKEKEYENNAHYRMIEFRHV